MRINKNIILFAALHSAAGLSSAPRDSVRIKEIEEITVIGGASKSLSLPMVVVNAGTLQTIPFTTPADALKYETGISISRDGVWATSVNVRGLSEQRLLFMVDGGRIQSATDVAGALSTVDMASLDKIEVIKGASSVLYGTGAMGGIVNFMPRRPVYSTGFNTSGKIGSGFHTVNDLWANSGRLEFTTQQWYIALNGSFRAAGNTQSPAGEIINSQFHDASWGLQAGIKYDSNEEFLVNYQHFGAWDVGLPGGSAFPQTARVRYRNVERDLLSGEYIITDINDRLEQISIKLYTQSISRHVENTPNPAAVNFPRMLILPSSLNTTSGAKITSDWQLSDRGKLIVGAEGWLRDSQTSRKRIATQSDTLVVVTGEQPSPDASMYDLGIFSQYSWKVVPKKLSVNAGIRLDYIRTENDSAFQPLYMYRVTNGIRKDVDNLRRAVLFPSGVQSELSYAAHLDLVWHVARHHALTLMLANSYRAASIEERFKYIDLSANVYTGNPALKPERGTFSNLNYTFYFDNFQLKTDVFANYLMDLITDVQVAPRLFQNTNINKALYLGAEMDARWDAGTFFTLEANASYIHARDVDSDLPLRQIPPLRGFAALHYKASQLFTASFTALWAAAQEDIAAGESITDGYIIYNVNVQSVPYRAGNLELQLSGGVENILNALYTNHLTASRTGLSKFPEPGRNVFLKAMFSF